VGWLGWLLSFCLGGAMLGAGYGLIKWLRDPATLPIRLVKIEGDVVNLQRSTVEQAISHEIRSGFFGVDVGVVKRAAEQLAWVESARVRRIWPDQLSLRVVERKAYARWGEKGLLTAEGQTFYPEDGRLPTDLPWLDGPPGSEWHMLGAYQLLVRVLEKYKLHLVKVMLDARGSWSLTLNDGLVLVMGRDAQGDRLERFLHFFPTLTAVGNVAGLERVDLRYANGMAVRWKHIEPQEEPVKPTSKGSARVTLGRQGTPPAPGWRLGWNEQEV